MALKDMSVKDLRKMAVKFGMSKEDADLFDLKSPLIATIKTLKTLKVKVDEVERVKTLNPIESLGEKRKINKKWMSKAEIMRKKLESQPKIRFMIPLSGVEKPGIVKEKIINGRKEFIAVSGAIEIVQLNGYKTLVPKGVFINIPEQIADVLSEAHRLTQEAGKEFLIDRLDPKTGKPVSDSLG